MRAAIYTRVSQDQAGGRSVAEQEAECRAVCEREGWEIVRTFCDNDRSASKYAKKSRPEYVQLMTFIEQQQCDVLVTWESSRAQRDLSAYVALRDACEAAQVLWNYSGRTYDLSKADDRMSTGTDALISERESAQTRERILRATRANATAGKPHGKIPYGYAREYDPATGALLRQVIDEEQASIIRECASRFLSGESAHAIAKDLNAREVLPPYPYKFEMRNGNKVKVRNTKAKWEQTRLRRILTNPAYIAKRVHKGEIVGDAVWPAILDESSYYRCAAKFSDPSRKFCHDPAVKYLLSIIAECGVCGGQMVTRKSRDNGNGFSRSYACVSAWCVARKIDDVDAHVEAVLLERLSRPDALALFNDDDDAATGDILDEITALRGRLDGFYDAAAAGDITAQALARIEPGLLAQIKEQEARIKNSGVPTVLYDLVDAPKAVWETLSITQKRECIKTLMRVRILKAGKGKRHFDPNMIKIIWRESDEDVPIAQG